MQEQIAAFLVSRRAQQASTNSSQSLSVRTARSFVIFRHPQTLRARVSTKFAIPLFRLWFEAMTGRSAPAKKLFLSATLAVTIVLYRREFYSPILIALKEVRP